MVPLAAAMAAAAAAAVAGGLPPRFVASWQGATRALPNAFLPDVPLLGNGHIGVLMDTTTDGPAAGHTSSDFTIRPSTRCNSVEGHTGKLLNVGLSQCEKLCAKSPSCAAFSHGETGSCFRTSQSCCFADLKDTSQCTPGVAGFTSGIRAPNGPAPVPRGGLNATVNLQFGSNAMWALQTCDNASASDPFGPQWKPAMAPACGNVIALGGLKVTLPVRSGVLNITSEQRYSSPQLTARLRVDGSRGLTVTSYIHPSENLLVTNLTAGADPITVSLETWAVNTGASPSLASLGHGGAVGAVTRRAIANDSALPQAKHVVAALASASTAVKRWLLGPSPGSAAVARAALALAANETVSVFTAFADNALRGSGSGAGAAAAVTAAATLAAATAASTAGSAAAVAGARQRWWAGFWNKSSVSLPASPAVERYWYEANYITGSMASTNPRVPAPGLFGPWVSPSVAPLRASGNI